MPMIRSQASKDAGTESEITCKPQNTSRLKAADRLPAKPSKPEQQERSSGSSPTTANVGDEKQLDDEDDAAVVVTNRAPVLNCGRPQLLSSCIHQCHGQHAGASAELSAPYLKRQQRREEQGNLEDVGIIGFHLDIQDGIALIGEKPRKANEDAVVKKLGLKNYNRVKSTFGTALTIWKGREDELNKETFHMYEDMRPTVPPGQKGWGRKGQLSLRTIEHVVSNPE